MFFDLSVYDGVNRLVNYLTACSKFRLTQIKVRTLFCVPSLIDQSLLLVNTDKQLVDCSSSQLYAKPINTYVMTHISI